MKKLSKRLAALAGAAALCFTLTACDDGDKFDPVTSVQGLMDMAYLGQLSDVMKEQDFTDADMQESYLANLEGESYSFIYNFLELDEFPNDDLKDQCMEMYKKIYAKSDYTVSEASEREDGGYNVTVKVRPLDFMHLVNEGYDGWAESFTAQYTDEELEAMDDETFSLEVTKSFLDYAATKVDSIAKLDEKSIVVQLEAEEEKDNTIYYNLNDDDYANLDLLIIDYNVQ